MQLVFFHCNEENVMHVVNSFIIYHNAEVVMYFTGQELTTLNEDEVQHLLGFEAGNYIP
jgi:hypothetical protein